MVERMFIVALTPGQTLVEGTTFYKGLVIWGCFVALFVLKI